MTYIERLKETLEKILEIDLLGFIKTLRGTRDREASAYVLGNGGSEALAQHLVLHLRDVRIKAFDLMADPAWLTAQANDYGYHNVAISLLDVLWREGDVLILISGSAKSENIKAAARMIHAIGGICLGIFGDNGGKLHPLCTWSICLPQTEYGPLEDAFSAIIHMIFEGLENG